MRNKKIGMGTSIAVFVAVIMISSATAVPMVNEEAAEFNYTVEQQTVGNDLEKLVYDKTFEVLYSAEFLEKLEWFKDTVYTEIEKLPVEYQQLVIDFFDLDDAFSLGRMNNYLLRVRPPGDGPGFMNIIQEMINPPNNYNHLNSSQNERMIGFIGMVYDEEEGIVRPVSLEDDMIFPIVEVICAGLKVISLIWTIPLTIIFGALGAAAASFITCVIFAPFWLPMSIYVGTMTAIIEDDELYNELENLLFTCGVACLIVLGIPVILSWILQHGYLNDAIHYVLGNILIVTWTPDGGLLTGDISPLLSHVTVIGDNWEEGEIVDFFVRARDTDKVYNESEWRYRDYIQVGIDWDNDKLVDEWTYLKEPASACEFPIPHVFNEPGTYTVNFIVRELWGLRGENWQTVYVDIEEEESMEFSSPSEGAGAYSNGCESGETT